MRENAEVHSLYSYDWMNMHSFKEKLSTTDRIMILCIQRILMSVVIYDLRNMLEVNLL